MNLEDILKELQPYLISLAVAIVSSLIMLVRTSTSSIVNRLNKKNAVLDRSVVTDPTGYYSASNLISDDYKVYYQGKEVDKNEIRIVRARELGKDKKL